MDKIHLRLKEFIAKYDLKNKDISEITGFSVQKISDLRSGKQNTTPEIALVFEDVYKLNPCWLIFGRGSMIVDVAFDLENNEKKQITIEELQKQVNEMSNILNQVIKEKND
jgi:plasmid maintenance system antidote protein VapI